jgi:hydroxyacylglutathione hydrolase
MRSRLGIGEVSMENVCAAIIPVTEFQQNCTLMWCAKTMRAVVVDPGGDLPRLRQAIAETEVTVEKIWLTHGHIDHAGAAAELRQELGVPIEGPHRAEEFLLGHIAASGLKFVGVVLFSGSIGRSDLPGGDDAALLRSINDKLLPLGDDVAFICGHGPASTIGRERASNPFLK